MMSAMMGGKSPAERQPVHGVNLDGETRCAHYHSAVDIVAIRLRCCNEYYACKECHDALADHPLAQWPRDAFDSRAVMCGACGTELTINAYLSCESRCPSCGARFNPACSRHYHYYFSMDELLG